MSEDFNRRLATLLTGLADYYRQPISESATRIYAMCLSQFPIDDIEAAAAIHVNDPDRGKFMPKVADFVAVMEGNVEESAALAWDRVLGRRDPWKRVDGIVEKDEWGRPIRQPYDEIDEINAAVIKSMGGWDTAIGQRNSADMAFVFKDFLIRFKAYKRRGKNEKSLLNLGNVLSITQGGKR